MVEWNTRCVAFDLECVGWASFSVAHTCVRAHAAECGGASCGECQAARVARMLFIP